MGGASAFELEVVRIVNEIRADHGLNQLVIDQTLMMAARFYAQTMANLDLPLGHREGPYGGSRETLQAFGFTGAAAMNGSAGRWTAQGLVDGWMNSPGHRDNILSPRAVSIGVGSQLGGRWGIFHYQMFEWRWD